MIHRPNRKQWRRNAIVIRDRDAKEHRMLRRITGFRRRFDGALLAITAFAFPDELPEHWRGRTDICELGQLHDPRRYGMKIRNNGVAS